MKKILYLLLIVLCCFSVGCNTTRKSAQSSTEQHISSSKQIDSNTAIINSEAVNVNQNTNVLTNAVIKFTKTEYFDGTMNIDTTANQDEFAVPRTLNRESYVPPNHGGVKSITTGQIELNNEKNESTNADIRKNDEMKSVNSVNESVTVENVANSKSDVEPKRGIIYYLGDIICGVLSAIGLLFIAYRIKKYRAKSKQPFA